MPGYQVKSENIQIGLRSLQIRTLLDRNQFADPANVAAGLGISSATWSYFGVLWPAARALTELLSQRPAPDGKILELGCGIALPSLSLLQRGAAVSATDIHPLAEAFLQHNLKVNNLPSLPFRRGDWSIDRLPFGTFGTIIASDVMYERRHPAQLAACIDLYAAAVVEVVIADPGRGNTAKLSSEMQRRGYACREIGAKISSNEPGKRIRFFQFCRS